MKKRWLACAACLLLGLIMMSAMGALAEDKLPDPQFTFDSGSVVRGEFLAVRITNMDEFAPYLNTPSFKITAIPCYTPDDIWFDAVDWNGRGTIWIPTGAFPAGDCTEPFTLHVYAMNSTLSEGHAEATFTVEEPAEGEIRFSVSESSVLTRDDFVFSVYAPGATRISLCDPWSVVAKYDGESLTAPHGYNYRGNYAFHAEVYYEETGMTRYTDPITVEVTAPYGDVQLSGVSCEPLVTFGDGISLKVGDTSSYESWNINVHRARDNMEVWHAWGSPQKTVTVPAVMPVHLGYMSKFDPLWEEGTVILEAGELYNVSLGLFRRGYHGATFDAHVLVEDGNVHVSDIVTLVNGREGSMDLEVGTEMHVTVQAPEEATALAIYDGHDWKYMDQNWADYGAQWWTLSHYNDYLYYARYTTDPVTQDMFNQYDFDWNSLNWSGISNVVRVHTVAYGRLPDPEIRLEADTVEQGSWLTAEITNLDAFADYEGVSFRASISYEPWGRWYGFVYTGDGTGTIRIPTAHLDLENKTEPFTLYMSTHMGNGWYEGDGMAEFSLTPPASQEIRFDIVPRKLKTGEEASISVSAPGAAEVAVWKNDWEEWRREGTGLMERWTAGEEGRTSWRAAVRYEGSGEWVFTDSLEVEAEAPEGDLQGAVSLPRSVSAGEDLTLSVTSVPEGASVDIRVEAEDGTLTWHVWGETGTYVVPSVEPLGEYMREKCHAAGETVLQAGEWYTVHVGLSCPGYNNKYIPGRILVVGPDTFDSRVSLTVGGSTEEASPLVNEDVPIHIEAPASATGFLFHDGYSWQWMETPDFTWAWDQADTKVCSARYTTDPLPDGEWSWEDLDWSGCSALVAVTPVLYGTLPDPDAVLETASVARGEWLTVRIRNAQDYAGVEGVNINAAPIIPEWSGAWYDWDGEGLILIPTSELREDGEERTICLHVNSFVGPGWRGGHTELIFTLLPPQVSGPDIRVSRTQAETEEGYIVSAFAPGASRIRVWQDQDIVFEDDRESYSDRWSDCHPNTHTYRVSGLYSGNWVDSDEVSVRVEAPCGPLTGVTVQAPQVLAAGEEATFHLVCDDGAGYDSADINVNRSRDGERIWHAWGEREAFTVPCVQGGEEPDTESLLPEGETLLEVGEVYRYHVNIRRRGYDAIDVDGAFLVSEDGSAEPALILNRDSMLASEGVVDVMAIAPGAERLELSITWDRDPYWLDRFEEDGDTAFWSWGCGSGGTYTMTLRMFDANGQEMGCISREFTVISDGALEKTVITGVPAVLEAGQEIHGSFTPVDGAQNYQVELWLAPENQDWEMISWAEYESSDPDLGRLDFSGCFDRPGRYRVSVNANALGVDNAFCEKWVLVLGGQEEESLVLRVNGKTDGDELDDIYLNMDLQLAVDAPQDVTAVRIWNGQWWDYWTDRFTGGQGAYEEGQMTLIAQATRDAFTEDTDMGQLNWSMVSAPVSVQVIQVGEFPELHIDVPETVRRGDWLEITLHDIGQPAMYGVRIERLDGNGMPEETVVDAPYGEPGTYRIGTAAFQEGTYRLMADPRRYGWKGTQVYRVLTVTGDPAPAAHLRFSQTSALTNEPVSVSVYAPGAEEVRLCRESMDDEWLSGGEAIGDVVILEWPDTYLFRAYARYPGESGWVQIGEDTVITAEALYEPGSISLTGTCILARGETAEFTGVYGQGVDSIDRFYLNLVDEDGVNLMERAGNRAVFDYTEEDGHAVVRVSIPGDLITGTAYRVDAGFHPYERGAVWAETQTVMVVTEKATEKIGTSLRESYETLEWADFKAVAPGAVHISVWDMTEGISAEEALLAEGDGEFLDTRIVFGDTEGTMNVQIRADYASGSPAVYNGTVLLTAPHGSLIGPRLWMDGEWTEGSPLAFRVDSEHARMIVTEVKDAQSGESVYYDEWPREDDWTYQLPASLFTPGHRYEIGIYSAEVGYNANYTAFTVALLPSHARTLTLPAGLTRIDEEAFEGISAQVLVIPEGVESIGARAFADCEDLLVVRFPADCSGISLEAFDGCGQITAYGPAGSSLETYGFQSGYVNHICIP